MSVTIPAKSHLDADGVLNLRVATGLPESDVEVVLTIRRAASQVSTWPEDFFEETYGAFSECRIERGSQGEFGDHEDLC